MKKFCITGVLFIFLGMLWDSADAASWYNSSWQYRKKITIDRTKVPNTNQTNFPVLISRTDSALKDTTNNGHVGQADAGDIVFTSSDGATKLDHEIEKYTPSTGELVAWVEVPTVSTSADTDIYIYYGNATCNNQWNVNGVWDSNYVGVWHMREGSGNISDSTSNGRTGTPTGGPTYNATGKIGNSIGFDAIDDYFYTSAPSGLTTATIEMWINITTINQFISMNTFAYTDSASVTAFGHDKNLRVDTAGNLNFYCYEGSTITGTTVLSTGTYYHVVARVGSSGTFLYLNGAQDATAAGTTSWDGGLYFLIGAHDKDASVGTYFEGYLDEVRVSNTARSADWIATSYNNQSSPGTFYSVAGEENVPVTTLRNATIRNATIR